MTNTTLTLAEAGREALLLLDENIVRYGPHGFYCGACGERIDKSGYHDASNHAATCRYAALLPHIKKAREGRKVASGAKGGRDANKNE